MMSHCGLYLAGKAILTSGILMEKKHGAGNDTFKFNMAIVVTS
jgi:cytochrome b561